MNWLLQIYQISWMNIRNVPERLGSSLVIVIGIAGVVAVLVALLAMAEGFRQTLASTGRADRVLVLRSGATDELSSGFDREQGLVIAQGPGVRRGADGQPLASMERYVLTNQVNRANNEPSNVPARGVDEAAFTLRPEIKIIEGRRFNPGTREVIVGRSAAKQFAHTEIGAQIPIRDGDWTVVGLFESGGDVHESELWVDRAALDSVMRSSFIASVMVQLEQESGFDAFKVALANDPRVNVESRRQNEYYAAQSRATNLFINGLGMVVGIIMGVGAIFAALNTMFSAVSTRTVEIGTLRAIGFGATPVVISVLIEALLLALIGGAIGGAIAFVVFNGYTVSTLNFQTFSQVAFAFRVTPPLLTLGIFLAVLIGLVGGLIPAVYAARLPITQALRAT